jgi:hypothetical protein
MSDDEGLSRRKILGSTAIIGAALSGGAATWAQLSDTEVKRVFANASAGLDLQVEGQDGVIRVPDDGSLELAGGQTYEDIEELTNIGSVPGQQVGVNLQITGTGEGEFNPSSETDTDPGNGGEFDDHLQIRAWVQQNGSVDGYFFGDGTTYVPIQQAQGAGETYVTLDDSLTYTGPPTNLGFELLYPDFFEDAIGDTITFELSVSLYQDIQTSG